jgi:phosphohistidine swiveling domain-containing protein
VKTLKAFMAFYPELMLIAYAAMDTLDVIDVLPERKRPAFIRWAEKTRKRSERIYKMGDYEFLPKYLQWFARTHYPIADPKLLGYIASVEMRSFLDHGTPLPSVAELRNRKRLLFIRQYGRDQLDLFTGSGARREITRRKLFARQKISGTTVRGFVAFPGKAVGPTHIVIHAKDMRGFKRGSVLISNMTQPNFLPVMKQAAAFVTDEGGILSHAAIVARELKKPCVIGTKHATRLFKDGDRVEVDAIRGIVKKL